MPADNPFEDRFSARNRLNLTNHLFYKILPPNPLTSPIPLPFFLLRPRKRAKKKGAARRGAGFSVNHLCGANGIWLPCHRIRQSRATVPDGIARKNPSRHHRTAKRLSVKDNRVDWRYRRTSSNLVVPGSEGILPSSRRSCVRRGDPCGRPPCSAHVNGLFLILAFTSSQRLIANRCPHQKRCQSIYKGISASEGYQSRAR